MNLNKTRIGIVSACLISFLIGASFVYLVYANPDNTFYVSTGAYPQASITVWRDGSYYYAKNAFGQMPAYGIGNTNASYVINSALSTGGEVKLLDFTYVVDTTIIMRNDSHLIGSSKRGTILSSTIATNTPVISTEGISPSTAIFGLALRDLTIDANNNGGDGIFWERATRDSEIINVEVSDMGRDGISLNHSNAIHLERVNTWGNTRHGYHIQYRSHGAGLYHCTANNNGGYGLIVNASLGTTSQISIFGGNYEQNALGEMFLDRVKACDVIGVYFENSGAGITQFRLTDITGASISYSNTLKGCYFNGGAINSNTAIMLNRSYSNDVSFNYITQVACGINLTSTADFNTIDTNQFITVTTQIDNDGDQNKILSVAYEWLIMRSHPSDAGWGANEEGRFWYCTTHDVLEYYNGTDIHTP